MLFSRNPFAALLVATAVGVKGSPDVSSKSPGQFRLYNHPGFVGTLTSYPINADGFACLDLASDTDNDAYSFQSDPWFKCIGFKDHGCPSLPAERYINLGSEVANLCAIGFGGAISSLFCFTNDILGWTQFCLGYEFQGDCTVHKVTVDDPSCFDIVGHYNDKFYSFRTSPGITCDGFVDYGCSLTPGNVAVPLQPQVGNLTSIGLGGTVSSYSCRKSIPVGFVSFRSEWSYS